MKFLYQFDFNSEHFEEQLDEFWKRNDCKEDVRSFSNSIIMETLEHKSEIDKILEKVCDRWALSRMAAIDRNILRFSVCELCFFETPANVVIDEAIEIAKKYGGENSSDFINGILDRIHSDSKKSFSKTKI